MLFRGLEDNTRGRCVGQFGRFADQGKEQVCGVELAEPVDAEVAVYVVGIEAKLVCVDAGRENELCQWRRCLAICSAE
jgi:hypothetical protein